MDRVSLNLASYTFLAIAGRALNVYGVLLFARELQPSAFGTLGFLQASTALIVAIVSLNLTVPMTVVLANGLSSRRCLENTILAAMFLAVATAAALAAVLSFTLTFPDLRLSVRDMVWFSMLAASSAVQIFSAAALVARGQKMLSATTTLLSAATAPAVLFVYPVNTLRQALSISVIALATGVIPALIALFRRGFEIRRDAVALAVSDFLRRRGKVLMLFSLNSFAASTLFQAALWYLQRQLIIRAGPTENAIFTIGAQFYNVVIFLPGIFGPLFLRRISPLGLQQRLALVAKATTISFMACICGVVAFYFLSPVMTSFLPHKYQIGPTPLILAIIAGAIMFIKFPISVFFQSYIRATPELFASAVAGAALLIGSAVPLFTENATTALWLRVVAHALQLMTAVGFLYGWRLRKGNLG